ncbi:MAG: M42 family metallopeptidase [Candidatus Bipolaricaulia bacterium]
MDTTDLLQTLSDAFGPPGFEDDVRAALREVVEPLVDDVRVDPLGNLIATRHGRSERTLMLDAHMDEVGLMVSYVEETGFLRFATLGGWDARVIPSHGVSIKADTGDHVHGVVGTPPPHILKAEDRKKPFELDELFIDVGARSRDDAHRMGIHKGSPAVVHYPFRTMNHPFVTGKALDDRAGCTVLVQTLDALQNADLDVTLVANFAVFEEVGLRGARTAAFAIEPDVALALEGTVAADVPGIDDARVPTKLGQGPALTVADRSLIASPRLLRLIQDVATDDGIPCQLKTPPSGSTDAGAIQQSRGGVLAGVVSVPCRYIHSPFSILDLDDLDNAAQLTSAFARRAHELVEA